MKNNFLYLFTSLIVLVGLVLCFNNKDLGEQNRPTPTIIKEGNDEENQDARQEWFNLMHSAAPDTDWKAIELANSQQRHQSRIKAGSTSSLALRSGLEEEIIPGVIYGEWKERGSNNQAGSVLVTEYDSINNKIFTVSAGGTLWKGELDGSNWEVINQDLRFNDQLLRFIEGPNGRRLIAQSGRTPHYSDDDGLTWTASTGIPFIDGWGATRHPIVLGNEDHHIYMFSKPDYWSAITLYKSTDKGETYFPIQDFSDSDMNLYALCNPHGTEEVYLLSRENGITEIFRINPMTNDLEPLSANSDFTLGDVRGNLIGTQIDTITRLFVYDANSVVHTTDDFGITWTEKGTIPAHPWSVGMYVSPSDPNLMIAGGLECQKSYNGGETWFVMNTWGEYYSDIDNKLHADMMYFNEFNDINSGESFVLISNHGGMSISWDGMASTQNIGKEGLNVGQFYDISTDPTDHNFVYGGSQDQGFQRGFAFNPDEVMEMEQVISGDYGHTVFARGGDRLWTVYPGGWVTYYINPQTNGGPSASWTVESENESVWIPPLMADPNPDQNICYVAGGNMNGGTGSYIIQLEGDFNTVIPSQLPFNFREESGGGEVSAMAISPLNENLWYAATTNGRFFTSQDRGQTWEQTITFLPGGHYLYGSAIYPSKVDENIVYFAGSGYSNPAVYKSTDKGINFSSMVDGLPSTLVFGLAGDENEMFLFAGTENGPYVFYHEESKWYDLAGLCAPTQTYWSVEYLEDEQIARFGTYGRGAWDFQITQIPVGTEEVSSARNLNIFPNPSKGIFYLSETGLAISSDQQIQVINITGKVVFTKNISITNTGDNTYEIDLTHLPKGNYVVQIGTGKESRSSQIVLQ